jgi:hypothetical protein
MSSFSLTSIISWYSMCRPSVQPIFEISNFLSDSNSLGNRFWTCICEFANKILNRPKTAASSNIKSGLWIPMNVISTSKFRTLVIALCNLFTKSILTRSIVQDQLIKIMIIHETKHHFLNLILHTLFIDSEKSPNDSRVCSIRSIASSVEPFELQFNYFSCHSHL